MRATGLLAELLLARVRRSGGRWWLVAVGIALCGVLPVIAAASTELTAQAALRQGLADLPVGERSVIVSYNGILEPDDAAAADRQVRARLPGLTSAAIRRQLIYRPISDGHGGSFVLGATDALTSAVRLVSGRLPVACEPARCEVVEVDGRASDRPAGALDPGPLSALGLVVVGQAQRSDPLLLSGTFDPGDSPLLLAAGVDAGTRISTFSVFQRSYGWVAGLDLGRVGADGVADWVRRSADVHDRLWLDREGLFLTTPDGVLRSEDARARTSGRRFAALGSATALLLLGTAVAGGAAVRGDHQRFADALRRRGAGRRLLAALTAAEVAITVLAGVSIGLTGSAAITFALARRAELPAGHTALSAVLTALPAVLALSAVAGLLVVLVLAWPATGIAAERVAWRVVDAVAVGCLAVAVLLAARGGVGTATPDSDPLLPVLPALTLLAAALLLARAWLPLVRAVSHRLPHRAVALRLGLSAAGARPLRPVTTAAVLTAAIAATVFAAGYRATLDQGAVDQAAFAVPLDARVRAGDSLTLPLTADSLAGYAAASGNDAYAVLHAAGSLRLSAAESAAVQLVGVDPSVLPRMARWSSVTGGSDQAVPTDPGGPAEVRRRLQNGTAAAADRGLALPAGSRLTIRTPGPPVRLAVTAWVRADDGRQTGVPLAVRPVDPKDPSSPDGATLTGTLPAWRDLLASAPLRLVAIEAQQAADQVTQRLHGLGESNTDRAAPAGRLQLGAVDVDGRPVDPRPWTDWTGAGLKTTRSGAVTTLDYRLTTGSVVLGPRQPLGTPDAPLPVAVDPQTARTAGAGALTVVLDGASVQARVVATLARFPAQTGRFAVVDRQALSAVIDRNNPGGSQPDEIWLALAPDGVVSAAAVRGGLEVTERATVERDLRTDPVARSAGRLLLTGALLALGVAAAIVVLLVVAERREDATELYSWEADGVSPGTLRAALWWRAVAVVVPAVPAGVLTGLGLSGVVARLVAVTATARTPQPPLAAATGLGWAGATVAAGVLLALGLAGLVCAAALREPLPVRSRG